MNQETLNEIIACLPQGKTRFDYFKDRYALMLLSPVVSGGKKVAELKQTPYARLLEKPLIKQLLAASGSGILDHYLFDMVWNDPTYTFLLTLTTWEGKYRWQQTSRSGYNLVLQMNFTNQHEQQYRRLAKPSSEETFKCDGHPIMKRGERPFFRETLAWARIDLDFDDDEALIEEIQSDWVREAQHNIGEVLSDTDDPQTEIYISGLEGDSNDLKTYFNQVLKPYAEIWDEAMLAATIHFIQNELGIHTIFYHSYETGCVVKKCQPPRSLYADLPRQFCFQKTQQAPNFLQREKSFRHVLKKVSNPGWYKHELLRS